VIIHGALPRQPGATTSGDACTGTQKAEADAIAFITCTRYRIAATGQPASPATWAGTDPRAQPASVILAVGERIARAAGQVARHLDTTIPDARPAATSRSPATAPAQPSQQPSQAASTRRDARSPAQEALPRARLLSVLREAQAFYSAQVPGTWVPAYLESRGISPGTARAWQFGYAPREWAALTDHLRAAGYADEEIEGAGLARRSTRKTLIDHFRDRVMLPIRNEDGHIAGFTGRARPGTEPAAPRYLNSPETILYKKGDLLFGLHEARTALVGGAMPVIVEGPFDAIAVTIAGAGQFAGLAPCGTALTTGQAALLAGTCDLRRTGVLVGFDDDQAGRKAAIRAYAILRPHTPNLHSAALAGRDPAEILQAEGPTALRDTLSTAAVPLLGLIVDAELSRWEHRLADVEGPLRAMRSAAAILANLLPPDATEQVKAAAGNTELATLDDDDMQPVTPPQSPAIAQALPPDTAFQVTRLADKLGFTITETTIEVANAVTRQPPSRGTLNQPTTARLAARSFPVNPLDAPDERATAPLRRSAPPGQAWASHQHSANQL
jgi:DNA primase